MGLEQDLDRLATAELLQDEIHTDACSSNDVLPWTFVPDIYDQWPDGVGILVDSTNDL